eukprot:4645375-Amphidinium_carterae.1
MDAEDLVSFTPDSINPHACLARVWANGKGATYVPCVCTVHACCCLLRGGQCLQARIGDTVFCRQHQQVRLNFLAAYRIEIPLMPGATSRPRF